MNSAVPQVTVTDYPNEALLSNITNNISRIFNRSPQPPPNTHDIPIPFHDTSHLSLVNAKTTPTVQAHLWGDFATPFARSHAHHYTRIISADCLWMPSQHENLARSMLHFLAEEERACVWVVAGFHTGRATVAEFFDVAGRQGLDVEERWEVDVDGNRREWVRERTGAGEEITARKRWLVVSVLRRRRRDVEVGAGRGVP